MTSLHQGPTPPARADRPRIQDLAGAVLAGGDTEELLDLLVGSARTDLAARSALLVMPLTVGTWSYEIVEGPDAPQLLGRTVDAETELGRCLDDADAEGVEAVGALDIGSGPDSETGDLRRALLAVVDAAEHGTGFLGVLRDPGPEATAPFTAADRERLDSLAGLIALTLRAPSLGTSAQIDDERGRIARDLHDLAIQELFAVGMELEALTDSLADPDEPPSSARIRAAVASSVQGVENAVAQIRLIVQSLRRARVEATLTERLRHEVGLATAGLGFIPALRLPPHPSEMDAELPAEVAEDVVAVVREGLANAARHAHASAVAVSVSVFSEGVDRVVQVNVSDNGKGIDPTVTRRSGLANMSSRARRHSGWVDAFNLDPGTMISWRVTLPPA